MESTVELGDGTFRRIDIKKYRKTLFTNQMLYIFYPPMMMMTLLYAT